MSTGGNRNDDKIAGTNLPSLWAAFDTLQLCYTVIPQMKSYYRYGSFRDCKQARKDFMFALRLKGKSDEEAAYLAKERDDGNFRKKITERSSEGVWQLRSEPPANFPPQVPTSI
ncbi:hypothetical protein HDU98_010674 [Podochytrium sp. JEL0797]|nr:hypothetical protein HDU98_010674 [Podochytrium sp. JEL0797]